MDLGNKKVLTAEALKIGKLAYLAGLFLLIADNDCYREVKATLGDSKVFPQSSVNWTGRAFGSAAGRRAASVVSENLFMQTFVI